MLFQTAYESIVGIILMQNIDYNLNSILCPNFGTF